MKQKTGQSDIIDIASRREPFVDDYLIERMQRVDLRLHHPTPRNVALRFNKPWEGSVCTYHTVFRDGDRFRMYYRGSTYKPGAEEPKPSDVRPTRASVCYAESTDGIHWKRPELGLHKYGRSKQNNIILTEYTTNFTPFRDQNPACKPSERYKALSTCKRHGLFAFKSKDGIHWSLLRKDPVNTDGHLDSQNLAFWDNVQGCYLSYYRDWYGKAFSDAEGVRDIKVSRSKDFINWTGKRFLDYGDTPREQLYTNAITPYPGCEHVLVGFPKRFVPFRKLIEEDHGGVSDGVFMSSRDGEHWRRWTEAFIRPGLLRDAWFTRNSMTAWGLLQTKAERGDEPELSLFATEGYYTPRCRLRRYTLRQDGFVSVHAGGARGEFVTRPLTFEGDRLFLNVATSAAGSVRVELRDAGNKPIKGYGLRDCPEIYGDSLNECVCWKSGPDVGRLAGKPVRLRIVLQDADLYAVQFRRQGT